MEKKTKNQKALDNKMLDFRQYAKRVIYLVEKKYPNAAVDIKQLMLLYASGVNTILASKVFHQKHWIKGG